jgi:glycosyltransferase involved in cell wall biosynthesis
MKVLYIITKSEIGGAQIHIAGLLKKHIECRDTIAILAYPGGFLEDFCRENTISFFSNKYLENTWNLIQLIRAYQVVMKILSIHSPSVIACHSGIAGMIGRIAGYIAKIPTVYTVHSYAFMLGHPPLRKIVAFCVEYILAHITTATISVSKYAKNIACSAGIPYSRNITVIHNGVSVVDVAKEKKEQDEFHIVFVGRLAKPKRPDTIIRALTQITMSTQKRITFDIIGDGPDRVSLERLATEEKVAEHVKFHGALSSHEVLLVVKNADIFVLPTEWEGLPISILESMSVGVSVVASDVGGVSEIVTKETGVLMSKISQPADWADRISLLLADDQKRNELGINGEKFIREKFSFEETFKKTREVYEKVILKFTH